MKKTAFFLSVLLFTGASSARIDSDEKFFQELNKCTKTNDRLICSAKSKKQEGFVYFFEKKKAYVLSEEVLVSFDPLVGNTYWSQFSVFGCDDLLTADGYSYICDRAHMIKHYKCYSNYHKKGLIVLYYEDKYGFPKSKEVDDDGNVFCQNKFEELLP